MATKLKDLRITNVDFVDAGANPEAYIRLTKRNDMETMLSTSEDMIDNPNFWKRMVNAIAKAFHQEKETERVQEVIEPESIEKSGAVSFNDKFSEYKNIKICDEIWDVCYALQTSLCSIVNDDELDGANALSAMNESLNDFMEVANSAFKKWCSGKTADIVNNELEVTTTELEMMKSTKERLEEIIEKSVVVTDKKINTVITKGETDSMKIDKSKLNEAEKVLLDSIMKKCGIEVEDDSTATSTPQGGDITKGIGSQGQAANPATGISSTATTSVSGTNEGDDIYKGLSPAIRAEIEALKKFKEDAEEKELGEIAKKYEIIGKKQEELVPVLKNLKAAGGTAYEEMIAVLDSAVDVVEKSGIFTEIGKSGANTGSVSGDAWVRAETKAIDIMKSKNITKAQALDEVLKNDPELAAECEKEE
nr:MAG TPA: hypothetical protein [Caudoviricetes sp.]